MICKELLSCLGYPFFYHLIVFSTELGRFLAYIPKHKPIYLHSFVGTDQERAYLNILKTGSIKKYFAFFSSFMNGTQLDP